MRWIIDRDKTKAQRLIQLQENAEIMDECIVSKIKIRKNDRYARVHLHGKQEFLHRVVFWLGSDYENISDLPKDKHVAHLCRNITCLNPNHYALVTPLENSKHKIRDGTTNTGERHPRTKLTLEKAQAIANSWSEEISKKARAERFGVTKSIVEKIDARTNWHQVTHPNGKLPELHLHKKRNEQTDYNIEEIEKIRLSLKERSHEEQDCWKWNKPYDYRPMMGLFSQQKIAARWACITHDGKEQRSMMALHSCGNEWCVKPQHLRFGTALENAADKVRHDTNGVKLKNEQVKAIRASTMSPFNLSEIYGVSIQSIRKIISGATWKCLA